MFKPAKPKMNWQFITRAISWLYARGHTFNNSPSAKKLGFMLASDHALPPEIRNGLRGKGDNARPRFVEFFDALPPGERPPLVSFSGNPMRFDGRGVPKVDREEAKKRRQLVRDDDGKPAPKPKPRPKKVQSFYETREWRELRYKALQIHGARCMCCGATPQTGAVMHVDHIKPRSRYPHLELELSNLQVLCGDCNLGKSNKDKTDFRGRWREEPNQLDREYRRIMEGV
ncbi:MULTISPECIES: HNH endonuclease signature motif containing protein [unclassified Azospirillum]|uniref:HNH endonuclease n=1 Tax=unclassified Azospirillum TaxID=2630922 RepID=UPI0018EE8D46|nr:MULTISPECIES: HNH endonuclease signature motif containing protein [unclassified Azospirillum]